MIRLINDFAEWSRTDACVWTILATAAIYGGFVAYVLVWA